MDLEELNKQMLAIETEFHKTNNDITASTTTFSDVNTINFQDIKSPIDTTQIKRPTKSGEHRGEINDKMNAINMAQYLPQKLITNPPNTMPTFTRNNNYNYVNNTQQGHSPQQQGNQQSHSLRQSQEQRQQSLLHDNSKQQNNNNNINNNNNNNTTNHLANYYSHNFDTLQNKKQEQFQNLQFQPTQEYPNQNQNQNNSFGMPNHEEENYNTHDKGMNLLNVSNMFSMGQIEQTPNKLNNSGYTKITDKKTDYRQNMNSKIDGFIFDNPIATGFNPILQNTMQNQSIQNQGMQKDTRMVIQDSSKDFYRQSANERMYHHSPMSRASNIPIEMASMSVNDFYSNMGSGNGNNGNNVFSNGFGNGTNNILSNEYESSKNKKEILNNRMNEYTPLAKTIQLQQPAQQNNQTNNQSNQNKQSNQANQQTQNFHNTAILKPVPQLQRPTGSNPNGWGDGNSGVNGINGKLRNAVFNDLPIISN